MPLVYPSDRLVREICWACRGTGVTFVSVDPWKFRKCWMCYGARGKSAPLQR